MLWSLIKIVLFVVVVATLTLGAGYLLESDGGVQITFAGTEYTLGPLQSVIAAIVMVFAVWLLLKVLALLGASWRFLNGDETALSRFFDRNRERKGYQALSEGMMALASGEARLAMSKADKAEKFLNKPELTSLLIAQAAEMSGDTRKAEEVYKKLVTNNATRFVGIRGIMKQKLASGDTETALKLAEKAFALKPKHEETQDILLKLQTGKEDWSEARKTLGAKLKYGSLPKEVHRRRDAVLALSEAKEIIAEGNSVEAREAAIAANRLSPDLIPATVMAATSYIEQGKLRFATRMLKKAWEVQPHPDLAAAYAAIVPDETPTERIKRFVQMTKANPDHPESRMVMAELNIAAEDFPEARRVLGDLVQTSPDARSVTIMAAIERGEGAPDKVVRGWLAKALSVPRGPHWICDNCQHIHSNWAPTCENCASFDTLSWKTPPKSEIASPSGLQMLPLIVGALDDRVEPDPADTKNDDIPDAELIEAEAALDANTKL
jgi:HemY protein